MSTGGFGRTNMNRGQRKSRCITTPLPVTRFPFDLLPEACHWFEQDGEMVCQSVYETSILWSLTRIQDDSEPPLSLDDLLK